MDAIVDELAKEERVAAAYDLWNQMREEVCRTYSEQLPERLLLSKQKEFKARAQHGRPGGASAGAG